MSAEAENPLGSWRDVPGPERWQWWQERWQEAIALSERYRLALRCGWWEDSIRVEALAAYATWLETYDTAVNIDPAGKLQLLAQLDWLRTVLRGGEHAFDPQADRPAFDRYLASIGARPPYMGQNGNNQPDPALEPQRQRDRRELARALAAIEQRLAELQQREHALRAAIDSPRDGTHAGRDLAELERTVAELRARQRELYRQLDQDA
jgi:hypothetical protein